VEDGYSQDRLLTDLKVGASAVPWLVETDYHCSGEIKGDKRGQTHFFPAIQQEALLIVFAIARGRDWRENMQQRTRSHLE
jgi:hypothetical protein